MKRDVLLPLALLLLFLANIEGKRGSFILTNVLLCLLSCFYLVTQCADRFVLEGATGSPMTTGCEENTADMACPTVREGLEASNPGDVVRVGPGELLPGPGLSEYVFRTSNVTVIGSGRDVTQVWSSNKPVFAVEDADDFAMLDLTVAAIGSRLITTGMLIACCWKKHTQPMLGLLFTGGNRVTLHRVRFLNNEIHLDVRPGRVSSPGACSLTITDCKFDTGGVVFGSDSACLSTDVTISRISSRATPFMPQAYLFEFNLVQNSVLSMTESVVTEAEVCQLRVPARCTHDVLSGFEFPISTCCSNIHCMPFRHL